MYCPSNKNYASVSCINIDAINLNKMWKIKFSNVLKTQEQFILDCKDDLIVEIY